MARSVKAKPAAGSNPRRHLSPEHRAKIAAALNRPETRARMSAAKKGRPLSPETRAKMSAARKGHEVSPEARARIAAALKGRPGRPLSPEHRAKIATARKGRRRGIPGSAAEGGGK